MIGLRWPRPALAERIAGRVEAMMAAGLLDEVEPGRAPAGCRGPPRQALGYKELIEHLDGAARSTRRSTRSSLRTRQFAVRQERWFRRDPRVRWIDIDRDPVAEAVPAVVDALASEPGPRMTTLTKHHGLGNDFLVAVPPRRRATCRRSPAGCATARRGIGADGLLVGESEPGHAARMVLYNADGSRAEMSGNGIRCFAQALAARRGDLTRADDPHRRRAAARRAAPTEDPHTLLATVDMGAVARSARARRVGRPSAPTRTAPWPTSTSATRTRVVGVDDVAAVDLLALGRQVPQVNLEIIEPGPGAGRHHDARPRARRRHHPGLRHRCRAQRRGRPPAGASSTPASRNWWCTWTAGSAKVALHRPEPGRVTLTGPATFVATIEVPVP